jgi:hypothetical protein
MAKSLFYSLILFFLGVTCATAQSAKDTVRLIKEFNEVMAFTVKPYLHYRTILSVRSQPAMRSTDTGNYHTEFYKVGDDLYYGSEQQEVYLQDSLMITLDHPRRTMQVSKVDVATKSSIDLLPLRHANIQKLLREHYLISRERLDGDSAEFVIRSQGNKDFTGTTTEMIVRYHPKTLEPYNIEVTFVFQQRVSDDALATLSRRGFSAEKLIQVRQGVRWLVLSQTISMQIVEMNEGRQEAQQMPLWTQKVAYDVGEQTFRGKGPYVDYEVTKTF